MNILQQLLKQRVEFDISDDLYTVLSKSYNNKLFDEKHSVNIYWFAQYVDVDFVVSLLQDSNSLLSYSGFCGSKLTNRADLKSINVWLSKEFFNLFDVNSVRANVFQPLLPLDVVSGKIIYRKNEIKDVIVDYLNNGIMRDLDLQPYIDGYTGKYIRIKDNFHIYGDIEIYDEYITIKEVPFNTDQQQMLKILSKLKTQGLIERFEDYSTGNSWNIKVFCETNMHEKNAWLKIFGLTKKIKIPSTFDHIYDYVDYRVRLMDDVISFHKTNIVNTIATVSNKLAEYNSAVDSGSSIEDIIERTRYLPSKQSMINKLIRLSEYEDFWSSITPKDYYIKSLNLVG